MIAGVIANTAAVCASVAITKDILDDPTRAAFYQSHWYIVWLIGLVLLSGACAAAFMGSRWRHAAHSRTSLAVALPLYMFTSFSMMVVKAVLGPKGAFPSWIMLILTSSANGCVFYGLFNATYPFSFFLQVQVYSVCASFGLCAYAIVACATQTVPCVGGFTAFGGWLFTMVACVVAYTKMDDAFSYLGYADSRTTGAALWHPWVALLLQLLFISNGVIQSVVSSGEAARFFEPDVAPPADKLSSSAV